MKSEWTPLNLKRDRYCFVQRASTFDDIPRRTAVIQKNLQMLILFQ